MEDYKIPEQAINCFEKMHQLRVTVHDLHGNLWPFLLPDRWHHTQPYCQAVKQCGGDRLCMEFEILRLREELASQPEGRFHVCHANLVEWVVPVFRGLELEWVLFAGVRLPDKKLQAALRAKRTHWAKSPWPERLKPPAVVDNAEAALILEHLRQVAARLRQWGNLTRQAVVQETAAGNAVDEVVSRRTTIQRFLQLHHTRPLALADLAQALHLSEGRTSHVVRESCGMTFKGLLIQARLHTAMELLRHSQLSVLDVAIRSGFDDVAHFHRLFRRRLGTTPRNYRIKTPV